MAFLIDTNVAIYVRDGEPDIVRRVGALDGAVLMSVVTRVELEGGVYREPRDAPIRRARLDEMLKSIPALAFDEASAEIYGRIVAEGGNSRRKLLDRMIAAQAVLHRATLITLNPQDFVGVRALTLIAWQAAR